MCILEWNLKSLRLNVFLIPVMGTTAWKVSLFGVILVRIFPHSDWIQRDTPYLSVLSPNAGKCGEILRISLNWIQMRKNVDQNNFERGHFLRSDGRVHRSNYADGAILRNYENYVDLSHHFRVLVKKRLFQGTRCSDCSRTYVMRISIQHKEN